MAGPINGYGIDLGGILVVSIFPYSETEITYLKKRDKKLGEAIDRIGMIEREVIPDLFVALVNTIVGQQISNKAKDTVWKRFLERFPKLTPEVVAGAGLETIQQCGISMRKAGYIRGVAEAILEGKLDLALLPNLPDEEVIKEITSLKGLGRWSAEMLLIFALQRPDIVSWNDLAIRKGMMTLYGLRELEKEQFEEYRRRYSPYGTVASLYLWEIAAGG